MVAITFFMLAVYISWEAVKSLIGHEEPLTSPVGLILAVLSLAVMTASAIRLIPPNMGGRGNRSMLSG